MFCDIKEKPRLELIPYVGDAPTAQVQGAFHVHVRRQ